MPGRRVSLEKVTRNVHFVNGDNDEIGGTMQHGSLTWAEMSEWMEIVYQLPLDEYAPFPCLEDGDPKDPASQHGAPINNLHTNTSVIEPGFYVLLSAQGLPIDIPINPDNPAPRTLSRSLSQPDSHTTQFRDRVRARDGRCVVTGDPRVDPNYTGLAAAHIFPVAHADLWVSGKWKQQINDDEYIGPTCIHSIQNGILLRDDVHHFFDKYYLAINPDTGYKSHCFVNSPQLDNKIMFRNPSTPEKFQPSRAILKHHFRMAVLLNMKGRTGYPQWDEDIPEGYDPIGEFASSEQGQLRLETELARKLNSLIT